MYRPLYPKGEVTAHGKVQLLLLSMSSIRDGYVSKMFLAPMEMFTWLKR